MDADAGGLLDDAGADLEQALPEGGELGPGERHPAGHGVAQGEHQPIGRGVQDQPELVGERALTGGAVRGELAYTDDAKAYRGMPFDHEAVKHSVAEYDVRDMAHTNGIESFWSMLKRGYQGTYHKMSAKHLQRYVNEFSGRHNIRERDTTDQMTAVVAGMVGKRLMY